MGEIDPGVEMPELDIGQTRQVFELFGIAIAGRQHIYLKSFFHQFPDHVKPELVDTPACVRYKSNPLFGP